MFYHGRFPLRRKMNTYPKDSRSSFRDISYPLWAEMLAYLVVPMNGLWSWNGLDYI